MKDLKKGDYLYELTYYDIFGGFKREVTRYKINKVLKNSYEIYGGYEWTIKKPEIGRTYFKSKSAMYKESLRLYKGQVKPILKEIGYLQKKLEELKEG